MAEGARRRSEPAPAVAEAEPSDRAGGRVARTQPRDEGELPRDQLDRVVVEVGGEGGQAGTVQLHPRVEEAVRPADEDDPDVEAFAAFDTRNDANDDVLKRRERGCG